jgi:hypothetical protein
MEDNPIYLKIFDPSKRERERERERDKDGFMDFRKSS